MKGCPALGRLALILLASISLVLVASAPACNSQSGDQLAAAIQAPAEALSGYPVELTGSATGARGDGDLAYEWSLVERPAGSEARMADSATGRASLTPDRPGRYAARLTVRQGKVESRAAEATFMAAPWFVQIADPPQPPGPPVPPVGTASGVLFDALGTVDGTVGGAWGDFDNDGRLDLAITHLPGRPAGVGSGSVGRAVTLYRNLGDGGFEDWTSMSGVALGCQQPGSPAWLDFDLDGQLDLFVPCESDPGESGLLQNVGTEGFRDVTREVHLEGSRGSEVVVGDYDNDGDPDLFVFGAGPDRLWENDNGRAFSDVTVATGIGDRGGPGGPAAFADVDNDGDLDIFVVGAGGGLFLNNGNRTFADVTGPSGAAEVTQKAEATTTRTVMPQDLDDDGDIDLVLTSNDGAERYFRNDLASTTGNNWLRMSLEGTISNPLGLGARVKLTTTAGAAQTAWLAGSRSSRAQAPMSLHFGLGKNEWANIKVTWPSGITQDFWFVTPNRTFWAKETTLAPW